MSNIETIFRFPQSEATVPYGISDQNKTMLLNNELNFLNKFHYDRCKSYTKIIDALYSGECCYDKTEDQPYLPIGLFKLHSLISEPSGARRIVSSGTTGNVSSVDINISTSVLQQRAFASIMGSFIGDDKRPMLIIDSEINMCNALSARTGALRGISMFSSNTHFLLDDNFKIDQLSLHRFLSNNSKFTIFGFTNLVWEHFYLKLPDIDLSNCILIHTGGWKGVSKYCVDKIKFNKNINAKFRLNNVLNFYGMTEQLGSVYMECEHGYFHASNFSEVVVRNFDDLSCNDVEEEGIIQTISLLPRSYPGHSILTEDIGIVHGVDTCKCGRLGTYFSLKGRLKESDKRGCAL